MTLYLARSTTAKPYRACLCLPLLQKHGAIPRDEIDYHVSVTAKSVANYKEVCEGDFIISLRSFQGGIEYSQFHGIMQPGVRDTPEEGRR